MLRIGRLGAGPCACPKHMKLCLRSAISVISCRVGGRPLPLTDLTEMASIVLYHMEFTSKRRRRALTDDAAKVGIQGREVCGQRLR